MKKLIGLLAVFMLTVCVFATDDIVLSERQCDGHRRGMSR